MPFNIRSERVRIGLSRAELAEKIGVHPNSVMLWEQNENQPGAISLMKLSKLFDCSPNYLLGLTDERK